MPHSISAKKRLRQNEARRAKNRAAKRTLRTLVRKVREAADAGNFEQSQAAFAEAVVRLDRAASHRTIHRNAAARLKSRLSARLKALKSKGK
jgi:small subunit ribosomal protein S20